MQAATTMLAFALGLTISGCEDRPAPTTPPASAPVSLSTLPAETLTLDLGGGVTMELVPIPAGEFVMGSPAHTNSQEPQHRVRISKPFYMGKYEVTQAQWEAVMGNNPSHFKGDDLPVEHLTWYECQAFCFILSQKVGREIRLPTEAEWEYACRAGTTTAYSFDDSSDELGPYAWFHGNSGSRTHPVGTKKPNAWGLHDMHGNVGEWCSDWFGPYGPESELQVDPTGPTTGQVRVLRGGTWGGHVGFLRCASRNWFTPNVLDSLIGFRLSLDFP